MGNTNQKHIEIVIDSLKKYELFNISYKRSFLSDYNYDKYLLILNKMCVKDRNDVTIYHPYSVRYGHEDTYYDIIRVQINNREYELWFIGQNRHIWLMETIMTCLHDSYKGIIKSEIDIHLPKELNNICYEYL